MTTVDTFTRADIVREARSHLGTPFRHQGRRPGVGLDCIGMLVMIARALGVTHQDLRAYPRSPDGKKLLEMLQIACDLLPSPKHAREGSVLVFEFCGPAWPQHVGILTDKGMIHTYSTVGRVCEHGYDATWRARTVAALDFKGVRP